MIACSKLIFLALVLAAMVGCGDGRPKRVPVAGQVLIDGKPLTHGEVRFTSTMGRAAQGYLDKDGRFRLSCYDENDGALPGTHKVTITAAKGISRTQTRWFAPKKYAEASTSGLTQEITGPTDSLVINISWEGGHEFVEEEAGAVDEGIAPGRKNRAKPAE